MTNKVLCIIQARFGSTRLPGKVLLPLQGKTVLEHIIKRVQKAEAVDKVVVATGIGDENDVIEVLCRDLNVDCFRGSEDDVLDRYYQAAKKFDYTNIVRITGDCPLIDPDIIDRVVRFFEKEQLEYATNVIPPTFPDGLDTEIFSFVALERAWKQADLKSNREHVTVYMWQNPDIFKQKHFNNSVDLSNHRWTLDNAEDYEVIKFIYDGLYEKNSQFHMKDVLSFLDQHPTIVNINKNIKRNEGLDKSFKEDANNMQFVESNRLLKQAKELIPNASQTLSKGYKMFVEGDFPLFASKAKGCHIWDVDGNSFIDYTCALAPIIIGYSIDEINDAIVRQLNDGIVFSLPHKLEVEVAKELVNIIPCAEMVRFVKNGADATSAAVRIARAYTGKDIILRSGYHGGQDWYLATQPPQDFGVPKIMKDLVDVFKYNDIESLKEKIEKYQGKIAAVIMEPVPMDSPREGYLEQIREITKQNDIVLIFDEIVTGFRMSLGGAQEYYNVIPDLACFGKAMANGMPISCVVGKRDIMERTEDVFVSTTFGGESLSLAASLATIDYIKKNNVIEHTWNMGSMLYDGINECIKKYSINAHCLGQKFKFKIIFNNEDDSESSLKRLFFLQQAVYRGIFFGTVITFNYSHKEKEILYTLKVIDEILKQMSEYSDDESKIGHMINGNMPVNKFYRDQR